MKALRDKRKLVEKIRWYIFKITYISTANYRRLQNLVPNISWGIVFWPKWLKYTKNLIWIFMKFNVKSINKGKLVEKWRWYTYKMSYMSAVY